jgi:hypothetical protein
MTFTATEDVGFAAAATLAMGEAFDRTCNSLRIIGDIVTVSEEYRKANN